jgi:hypothetical protein
MLTIIIILLIIAFVYPVVLRRKERRYWSQKQIDKRWEQEDARRYLRNI